MAPITINNNTLGISNNYIVSNIQNKLASNIAHLSSGLRIYTAKDDPAGMAISQSLKANSLSYQKGKQNVSDAVSLVQTADGAMDLINEQLTLMKELAEQASTGTYTDAQRTIMQSEFSLMAAEVDRIANETQFNTISLLDGSQSTISVYNTVSGWKEPNGKVLVHFGINDRRAEDYYYLNLPDAHMNKLLSGNSVSISTESGAKTALTQLNSAITKKDEFVSRLGTVQNRLEATMNNLDMLADTLNQAEANISSIDVADEITDFVSNLVQYQSAIAITAQANILPFHALALLNDSI